MAMMKAYFKMEKKVFLFFFGHAESVARRERDL